MKKRLKFNVTGPCMPDEHYMLDPLRGINDELMTLIDEKEYFVIHAARQTGKTTLLQELVRRINSKGDYYAVYCSLEVVLDSFDTDKSILTIEETIRIAIRDYKLPDGFGKNLEDNTPSNLVREALASYCNTLDKPLVIFFDEADCLTEQTLISFLRQLRYGFVNRSTASFVHSVALVGMLNLRDYKAHIRSDSESLEGASPFNIIKESVNLRNFYKEEVAELYAQHTENTGQVFEQDMIDFVFEQTQGQPWLVNAIACECVEKITKKDYSIPITKDMAQASVEKIVRDRRTHIDSMIGRLKDRRVRSIILPLLLGDSNYDKSSSDFLYTRDLGFIRETKEGKIEPANPIYAELIVRTLNYDAQESIKDDHEDYIVPRYLKNGIIDVNYLISDFQEYWRENSEIWKKRYKENYYEYDEAAPHLVLMAFLQRVVNGGGQVIREKALGPRRVDLCIVYEDQKYPIEIKVLQNERKREDSLVQAAAYADRLGSDTAWLVIFDRDTEKKWDDKIYIKEENVDGKKIVVVGV